MGALYREQTESSTENFPELGFSPRLQPSDGEPAEDPPDRATPRVRLASINPFRCKMWDRHDRLESLVTEQSCRAEIDSIARHGQLVPVLGRMLARDPDYDVELIYGARRLFCARHLNVALVVEIRDLSDIEAVIAMDIENRHRADISPYERGLSYSSWLRSGLFLSQEDIARALKLSCSYVSRLVKMSKLPTIIVDAFGSPAVIRETWALELMDALENQALRGRILNKARAIAKVSPRPRPEELLRTLLALPGVKRQRRAQEDVVKGVDNQPLFRIRYLERAVAFVVPADRFSGETIGVMRSAIATALEKCSRPEKAVQARKLEQSGSV